MFHESEDDNSNGMREAEKNRRALRVREKRNRETGLDFENEMFEGRSRYLILFVTLAYKDVYRDDISIYTIRAHRDRLFKNMGYDNHPVLSRIIGCMWRLEEGQVSGGLHLHLVIFFSGACRADIRIARGICDHWVNDVTAGWGSSWNSNANQDPLSYPWGVAIGQVNRTDEVKRSSLRNFIANYMAKNNQTPTMRNNPHLKLFGTRFFNRN